MRQLCSRPSSPAAAVEPHELVALEPSPAHAHAACHFHVFAAFPNPCEKNKKKSDVQSLSTLAAH